MTRSGDTWDFAPIKQNKPIEADRCQFIDWNPLLKLNKYAHIEPVIFVALLASIKQYDNTEVNLQHVCKAYAEIMNEWKNGSYMYVLKNENVNIEDKEAVYCIIKDYKVWTVRELSDALNTKNKIL